jgi:hypothetical protein
VIAGALFIGFRAYLQWLAGAPFISDMKKDG